MTAGGGRPEDGPEDGPEAWPNGGRPGDRDASSEAPPWERPGSPAWLLSTAAPPMGPVPRRRRAAPVAVVVVVVVVLLAGGGALVATSRGQRLAPDGSSNAFGSQPPGTRAGGVPPASSTTTPIASPQTAAQARARLDWMQQRLGEVRGLAFEHPIPADLLPTARLEERVERQVDADTDEARLAAEGRALELLGQLPHGTDLIALLRAAQAEGVLGYYVPGEGSGQGRLYVRADGGLTPFTEFLLAHELTHAVTDQHFDLTRGDRLRAAGRSDQLLGYLALIEGDATFTMQRYYQREMSAAEQLSVARESLSHRTPVLDAAPPVVRQALGFPYQAGMIFVQTLHQRGGWAAVNRAYADPPTSSEQILHPERYLAPRDEPQAVAVPDLRRTLGKGWKAGIDTGWGEADARFLLAEQVPVTAANDAAAGWDGGQLRTFERGGRTALVLRTVWDSAAEATEFCGTMRRWAGGRLGQATGGAAWAGDGQHAALVCAGTHATWLSAPDAATLQRLRAGLGGRP